MARFGEHLRAWRKAARLSQDELAARTGMSKAYISVIERNTPHPTTGALPQPPRKTVETLAIALGVPLQEALNAAFGVDEEGEELDPADEQAIAYYRGIPPELKPTARAVLKTLFEQTDRDE